MADVDAIAVAGAIYGVNNIVAAFEFRRKRHRSQWVTEYFHYGCAALRVASDSER